MSQAKTTDQLTNDIRDAFNLIRTLAKRLEALENEQQSQETNTQDVNFDWYDVQTLEDLMWALQIEGVPDNYQLSVCGQEGGFAKVSHENGFIYIDTEPVG